MIDLRVIWRKKPKKMLLCLFSFCLFFVEGGICFGLLLYSCIFLLLSEFIKDTLKRRSMTPQTQISLSETITPLLLSLLLGRNGCFMFIHWTAPTNVSGTREACQVQDDLNISIFPRSKHYPPNVLRTRRTLQ